MFTTTVIVINVVIDGFSGKHLILQSQSLEMFTTTVIVIHFVIDGVSGEHLKWLAHVTAWLQPNVQFSLHNMSNNMKAWAISDHRY